jgi:hypothetical protein
MEKDVIEVEAIFTGVSYTPDIEIQRVRYNIGTSFCGAGTNPDVHTGTTNEHTVMQIHIHQHYTSKNTAVRTQPWTQYRCKVSKEDGAHAGQCWRR